MPFNWASRRRQPLHAHRLRFGQWNARRDRNPARVVAYLRLMCRRRNLDVVLLQEFRQYRAAVRKHGVPGYTLHCPDRPDVAGDEQQAILVRDGIPVRHVKSKRMSKLGWFTITGAKHAPSYAPVALIGGWLRTMSVHAPVSVSWRRGLRARPYGPARRLAAYIGHSRRCVRWARAGILARKALAKLGLVRRTLMAGDWNAHVPMEEGTYSPKWVARSVGFHVFVPPQDGPGHKGIDYAVTDAEVRWMHRHGTGGSDHPFITYVVTA